MEATWKVKPFESPATRYLVAVASVFLAVLCRLALRPLTGETSPFFLLAVPVLISAFYGGVGPGCLSCGLGLLAGSYFFLPARFSFAAPTQRTHLLLFLAISAVTIWLTAKLRAVQTQREAARKKVEDVLAGIPDGFFIFDRQWRYVFVNDRAAFMAGRRREGLLGECLWELSPETFDSDAYQHLQLAMEENVPVQFESFHPALDRWYENTAYSVPEGVLVLCRDITDRKRDDQALRETQERYRFLSEALPQIVYVTAADGRIEYANRHWYEYTGLTPNQTLDTTEGWISVTHPDDVLAIAARRRRPISPGERIELEYRLRQASDGEYRWHLARSMPIRDEAGQVVRWFGAAVDIHDLKRTEQALRESEERFRLMADTAPVLIWIAGPDGLRTFFNKPWLEFTGRSLAEETGLGWQSAIHPGDVARYSHISGEAVAARRNFQIEYRLERAAGDYRWLLETGIPRLHPDGSLAGYIASCVDITDRKRTDEQIREAQKLESLGLLAGGVAHDFNNLLVGILGNASLALDTLSPSHPTRTILKEVIHASERAADLIRQMLAYAGKGRFMVRPVDISELVREINGLVRTSIPKNVQIRLELRPDVLPVEADPAQIQQIVMNLVINGAEAIGSEPGTVLVRTGIQQVDAKDLDAKYSGTDLRPGAYVTLDVQDTGCGMDEATKAKIFDPFFTTKFTGRGLGLAATLGIVRSHGGLLRVYTAPGKGSTFKVMLPAATNCEAQQHAAAQERQNLRGHGTILVVDDEESVRHTARLALERYGYRVLVANNGREAIELFTADSDRIDLVLLDLTMPEMDGEEALRCLRSKRPSVRVVLSSGFDEAEAVSHFAGKGLSGFVQKPYTSQTLARKIKSVLFPKS